MTAIPAVAAGALVSLLPTILGKGGDDLLSATIAGVLTSTCVLAFILDKSGLLATFVAGPSAR